MKDRDRPQIGIVGVGRAGGALGRALHAAGYPITSVWSRSTERAGTLAEATGAAIASTPAAVAGASKLVLVAVPDALIGPIGVQLADDVTGVEHMAVHLSGANDASALASLAKAGWLTGAFHPLQTFADDCSPVLPGTAFAIEAPEPLRDTLTMMTLALGGAPLQLAAGDRAIYHAAATMTANYTVTLIHVAANLLTQCGLAPEQALAALLPLLRGTVENLGRVGLPDALTGPIVRGDEATIRRHVAALSQRAPEALPIYRALGAATVALAEQRGEHIPQLDTIERIIAEPLSYAGHYNANHNS